MNKFNYLNPKNKLTNSNKIFKIHSKIYNTLNKSINKIFNNY